jgi:hypothetical protein
MKTLTEIENRIQQLTDFLLKRRKQLYQNCKYHHQVPLKMYKPRLLEDGSCRICRQKANNGTRELYELRVYKEIRDMLKQELEEGMDLSDTTREILNS